MARNHNTAPKVIVTLVIIGMTAILAYEQASHEATAPQNKIPVPQISALPVPQLPGAKCHMRGLLPDPVCTPGSIDPTVTDENVSTTICKSGYTATIRPSSSYTNKLKRQQMIEYGFTDSLSNHEEDHLISLQLGGAAADPTNLWPQPDASPNPKDKIETNLRVAVCAGRISLSEAQQRIATDWTTAANGLMVNR
ncbi:hypothetical protein H7Y63_01120 [Polaromonas sp.]|nr:hypothetical protein [Candidatus Saccharibacteria bacterium]